MVWLPPSPQGWYFTHGTRHPYNRRPSMGSDIRHRCWPRIKIEHRLTGSLAWCANHDATATGDTKTESNLNLQKQPTLRHSALQNPRVAQQRTAGRLFWRGFSTKSSSHALGVVMTLVAATTKRASFVMSTLSHRRGATDVQWLRPGLGGWRW